MWHQLNLKDVSLIEKIFFKNMILSLLAILINIS